MKTGTSLWTYDPSLDASQRSWTGYDVQASDGHIGKIDEMNTDTGRSSVLVDTGFWIFGKKRLIPAASVTSVDHATRQVNICLTKAQVKDAPDYDDVRRDDAEYWDTSTDYYGRML